MSKVFVAFIGDGHGEQTPGKRTPVIKSLGRSIKENEFNKPVADIIVSELQRHDVKVHHVAPSDEDVPLRERTDYANKLYWGYCNQYGKDNVVAVYVSVHFNAFDGTFDGADPSGFSVHIYPGSKSGRELATHVLNQIKNGTKQINRGIKENNFHVVRETAMPAVLTENGFMDNEREALLMLDKDFQREVGTEHAKGILSYFGLAYQDVKPEPTAQDDVTGHWAEEALRKAINKGLIVGDGKGSYFPDKALTRAQLITVLDRLGLLD